MRAIRFVLQSGLALVAAVPLAEAQSVSINATITGEIAPGVYGRVVLGTRPPPPLVYAQPVVAVPVVVAEPVAMEPIYLHVPPGHAKHWRKHCHEYNACNRPGAGVVLVAGLAPVLGMARGDGQIERLQPDPARRHPRHPHQPR